MDVVDEVVAPDATGVLVEAHGPEADHLGLGVGIEFGQCLKPVEWHARHFGGLLQRVFRHELRILVESHVGGVVCLRRAGRLLLQRMLRTQAVADVGLAALEHGVSADELLVDAPGLDDVVGDRIEQVEVGLRCEHHADVGQIERAVLEGGEHGDADMRRGEPAVGDPRPQDRVHLRHVGAPQHEGVGGLDVVIAAHRLVDAEGAHHTGDGGSHAVARIGVDVVGAEARLVQFGGGIAFPDRPLAGAEHADAARTALLQGVLELLRHDVERFVPADRRELAVLVVLAARLAQHRLGQPVVAVHDLGEEVALDAVQAAIDLALDIAMGGDHAVIFGGDHDAAAGAAKAAGGLVPLQFGGLALGDEIGGERRHRHPGGGGGDCGGLQLEQLATVEFGGGHCKSPGISGNEALAGVGGVEYERGRMHVRQQ
ncbi:hypothetical protein ES703_82838 [subsurface metagenome]